eukprot:SAG11_NODE_41584_length_192_cov_16.322581_1_plen_32_part_01
MIRYSGLNTRLAACRSILARTARTLVHVYVAV